MSAAAPFDVATLEPEIVRERIGAQPSLMLAATLGNVSRADEGDPIGWLAHWLHCLPVPPHGDLAENGHPARGRHLPDLPFERRMFAGSKVSFEAPIRIGATVTRTARVLDVVLKEGRSGAFYLMTVRQDYADESGRILVTDEQKIVYRQAVSQPGPADGHGATQAPTWTRTYLPDERMLFRYSALLFSAHRIHFDLPYTLGEGYPALVVHGQLVATCLADLATSATGRGLARFSYRSLGPLFSNSPFRVNGVPDGDGARLWAENVDGVVCVEATAAFAS